MFRSRELFSRTGMSVDQEKQAASEVEAFERVSDLEKKYSKESLQAAIDAREAFFDSVDFKILREIFADIYKKCGFDVETMNFIESNRIAVIDMEYGGGEYHGESNFIAIKNANIDVTQLDDLDFYDKKKKKFKQELVEDTYGSLELAMLHRLVHEEAHAISRNICVDIDSDKSNSSYSQSGLHRKARPNTKNWGEDTPTFQGKPIAQREDRVGSIFHQLNEGIVEVFASSVMDEYLKRIPKKNEAEDTYKKNKLERSRSFPYPDAQKMVNLIISTLSKKKGVSKEVVFHALIRGLIEGETFESDEVQDMFREAFDDDFLRDLSTAAWLGSIKRLLAKYAI